MKFILEKTVLEQEREERVHAARVVSWFNSEAYHLSYPPCTVRTYNGEELLLPLRCYPHLSFEEQFFNWGKKIVKKER